MSSISSTNRPLLSCIFKREPASVFFHPSLLAKDVREVSRNLEIT